MPPRSNSRGFQKEEESPDQVVHNSGWSYFLMKEKKIYINIFFLNLIIRLFSCIDNTAQYNMLQEAKRSRHPGTHKQTNV